MMTKANNGESVENNFKGIVGKTYLDIDRTFNVSDYMTGASKSLKNKKVK
jgi:hypothetical protein